MGMLQECGYQRIRTFGTIAMDPFHSGVSKDLVIIATTP
jgi:hypothetical protein